MALNGNDLTHPQLREFLEYLKSKKVIANITVNQRHFLKKFDFIKELVENKLIYGVGVSLSDSSENILYEYLEKNGYYTYNPTGAIVKSGVVTFNVEGKDIDVYAISGDRLSGELDKVLEDGANKVREISRNKFLDMKKKIGLYR